MPNPINSPYTMYRRFTYLVHALAGVGGAILLARGLMLAHPLELLLGVVALTAGALLRRYGLRKLAFRHIENGMDYQLHTRVKIHGREVVVDELVDRLLCEDLDPWERQRLRNELREVFRSCPELYPRFRNLLENGANFVPPPEVQGAA